MLLTRLKSLAIIGSTALLISACGSTPSTTSEGQASDNNASDTLVSFPESIEFDRILEELENIQQTPSPERDRQLLAFAERIPTLKTEDSIRQNQILLGSLLDINTDLLNTFEYGRFVIASSKLYSTTGNYSDLYDVVYSPRVSSELDFFTLEQQIAILEQRAQVDEYYLLVNDSLLSRIALAERLSDSIDLTQNTEMIWQTLNRLDQTTIDQSIITSTDTTLIGWYELAAIDREFIESPEKKYRAIRTWIQQNPSHPGATELPLDLQLLQLIFKNKPGHIALLLPLSGKFSGAANAIRDGFFSAYYNESESFTKPQVSLFDTHEQDVTTLYDKAINQGADFVIGPLSKDNVAALQQHVLSVPTLALNYIDNNSDNVRNINLYQFGLSLEDEAEQVAQYAIGQGLKYALVLADSNDWSIRTAQSFINQWQDLGGVIVDKRDYNKDSNFSDEIESLLNISESQSRATQLKRLFGENFEYEPRRRNDIDMIFLVSRANDGRQIKPILAFHYAGDVPVYATSQLYSSVEGTDKTRDLNGITVITLPWLIEDSKQKQAIENNIRITTSFERLYALGSDAYQLHNRLNFLSYTPAANTQPSFLRLTQTTFNQPSFSGTTGVLTVEDGRVKRTQPFIEIKQGKAERLTDIDTTNNDIP